MPGRLTWTGERAQRPEVHGHILNEFGFPARKLRLLVNSLDPAGALTDQTLVYVPGELRPGSRYYFDSRHACPHAWRATCRGVPVRVDPGRRGRPPSLTSAGLGAMVNRS